MNQPVSIDQEQLAQLQKYIQDSALINKNLQLNYEKSNDIINFTKGFMVGQLSVLCVIIVFIRFFVFSESGNKTSTKKKRLLTNGTVLHGNGHKIGPLDSVDAQNTHTRPGATVEAEADLDELSIMIDSILEKTYYNVATHQTESMDWFNVLVAQIIVQFRTEALFENNIIRSLDEFLSGWEKFPDWLDTVKIKEINIGNDYPIFSNCRIIKNSLGRLEAKIDVDLSDTLTLDLETKILINKPKFLTAALPIKLRVSIVRFSGCLCMSFDKGTGTGIRTGSAPMGVLTFGFSEDYRLEFKTESLIGSRSKLENVPKISYLIETQLKNWFQDRCVEPQFQEIPLPNLWPRKKNTRNL